MCLAAWVPQLVASCSVLNKLPAVRQTVAIEQQLYAGGGTEWVARIKAVEFVLLGEPPHVLYAQLVYSLGRSKSCHDSGRLFPCCTTILHLFSKITILPGHAGWGWLNKVRVESATGTPSTDQDHHQNSFPTPLLFPEETYRAASEECSPPIAVWHEREAHARPFDLLSTLCSLYWI